MACERPPVPMKLIIAFLFALSGSLLFVCLFSPTSVPYDSMALFSGVFM